MSARAKLEDLAKLLRTWSAKVPEDCEIVDPLDLFDHSLLRGDLEPRRIAGEELLQTSQLLQDIASTVGTASLHLTSCGQEANSLQAPMRLPFELLNRIFSIACQPSEQTHWQLLEFTQLAECRETRLAIAWSCSHFRSILQKSPIAWSHIPVMIDSSYNPLCGIRQLLSHEISMSGKCPVSFYVFVEHAKRKGMDEVAGYWKFLKQTIPLMRDRLRDLIITTNQSFRPPVALGMIPAGYVLPTLTSLEISFWGGDDPMEGLDIRKFPALEVLSIVYNRLSTRTFAEGTIPLVITSGSHSLIRSLNFSGNIALESFINIVMSCRESVETIRWVEVEDDLPPSSGTIKLPRLEKLHLEIEHPFSFLDPLRHTMLNLVDLTLNDWGGIVAQCVDVDKILLPSLETCNIGDSAWGHDPLRAFFWANPTIHSLSTTARISEVAEFFAATTSQPEEILPNLEVITFLDEIYSDKGFDPWCELIRARRKPYYVCFENLHKSVARHMHEDHPDIVKLLRGRC
ncbi:hypothetical protein DL93DRAFT_1649888 [Clavulina sp. PMI_390]|nr:hypothetical protein DL93DRAFT_1649888 [Clavulina sp. PMI_390]